MPNRYAGFSDLMDSFKTLGFLETTQLVTLSGWESLLHLSLGIRLNGIVKDPASVQSAIKDLIPPSQVEPLLHALDWLFSPVSLPPVPTKPAVPMDHFSVLLAHKLRYEENERDMVILHHEIVAHSKNSGEEEIHTSSLTTYGTSNSGSAMSRCVGLPVAFATLGVLDGGVRVRGVAGPSDESIYGSVLVGLEKVGLGMKESVRRGGGIEGILKSGLAVRCS